ncbi:MAG: hypothetical protein R2839_03010 [Thermomicrobiales bacterium]
MVVDVLPGMTLAQVIVRLREGHGDSVTVRISPESSLLLTANEFRALALAAEREQIAIAIETGDGLRRQLATLFGVPLVVPENVPTADEDDIATTGDSADTPPADPAEIADLRSTTLPPADTEVTSEARRPARRAVALRRILLAAFGLIAVVLVGVSGYWYFLRTAEIHLTSVTQPVTSTIAFSVLQPGADAAAAPGAIPSENVSFELSVSLDAPATGQETIGRTVATGSLVLRNPGAQPVLVPAGTEIQTFEGDVFVISEDVTVPAATPGSTAGESVAAVAAASPGAAGNREAGMLSGKLENDVYFSNRGTPVAGGTDETTTVVTQQDLDALATRAEETLRSLATTSLLSGNRRIVPSSLHIQQFTTTFSGGVGDPAESISVDATIRFDALAFPTDALDEGTEQALAGQVPAGYQLVPGTVSYQSPAESGQSNGVISMIVPVSAEMRAMIDEAGLEEIANSIADLSKSDANATLSADSRFTDVTINISPSWLPQRLPSNADRIEVNVE